MNNFTFQNITNYICKCSPCICQSSKQRKNKEFVHAIPPFFHDEVKTSYLRL